MTSTDAKAQLADDLSTDAKTSDSEAQLADDLGELFSRVSRRLRRATMTALEPCGISPHQARALRLVVRLGPLRPSQLAEHLSIALRSTTQVLDDLANSALVVREPDPLDRRAVLVRATPSGVELAEQIATIRGTQSRRFLGGLNDHDQSELRRILRLLDAAEAPVAG